MEVATALQHTPSFVMLAERLGKGISEKGALSAKRKGFMSRVETSDRIRLDNSMRQFSDFKYILDRERYC